MDDFDMIQNLVKLHIKRGHCCGSKCKCCPYSPKHVPNSVRLSRDPKLLNNINMAINDLKTSTFLRLVGGAKVRNRLLANTTILPGTTIHLVMGKPVSQKKEDSIWLNGKHVIDPWFRNCKRQKTNYNCSTQYTTGRVITEKLIVKGEELILRTT